MAKTTEAQKRASARWRERNREKVNYTNRRSDARAFIQALATLEDLAELAVMIEERQKEEKRPE